MNNLICRLLRIAAAICVVCGFAFPAPAQILTLRIVCYNIEDDIGVTNAYFMGTATTPLPGLIYPASGSTNTTSGGVLEGIGEEVLSDGIAQPIDVLALEETSGPSTVNPIVSGLNAFYSASNPLATNMYASSPYQATESGGTTNNGNGPNALVYNTKTLQLLASIPVDPVGGTSKLGADSGEYREVMRYEFSPAGQTPVTNTEFYVYVSHYKSTENGSSNTDIADREGEAEIIRTNETSLPASARVLYVGDYNVGGSSEPGYLTIVATNAPNGIAQGQGIDPLNLPPVNTNIDWTADSLLNEKTEDADRLHYRLDLQVCTTNVYHGTATGGLALVASTYHVFGNNGSIGYDDSVADGANTALNSDLAPGSPISGSQLYQDLIGAADHLPVVADYTIPVIAPMATFISAPTTTGVPPLAVTFIDTTTNGIATNWLWNFGDGSTSNTYTTTSVAHTYTNAGLYTVTETVTGPGGTNSAVKTNLITILTPYQAWQLQYFGCTNCSQSQTNADADGTGENNLFKYVAGLNPTNPASVFVFNAASASNRPPGINLIYSPVEAGRTYTALYTTNLATTNWVPLTTTVTNIIGVQATMTDTNAGQTQKFYQIKISGPAP